jgi:hypothetical protein
VLPTSISSDPHNRRGGATRWRRLQAMITDGSLTVSEAVQWCAGAISHREVARLRQLTAQRCSESPND